MDEERVAEESWEVGGEGEVMGEGRLEKAPGGGESSAGWQLGPGGGRAAGAGASESSSSSRRYVSTGLW